MRYVDIEADIRTGDIFLFHGVSFLSKVIEFVQSTPYSHCGVAVRDDEHASPLLLHVAAFGVVPDQAAGGEYHTGVQLNSLRDTLKAYAEVDETAFYRPLHVTRTNEMATAVTEFITAADGRPFSRISGTVKWIEGRLMHIETGKQSFFCSQLVADLYQQIGLLPPRPPANAYEPRDFANESENLALRKDARLGDQIAVTAE